MNRVLVVVADGGGGAVKSDTRLFVTEFESYSQRVNRPTRSQLESNGVRATPAVGFPGPQWVSMDRVTRDGRDTESGSPVKNNDFGPESSGFDP
ncbi:hypothetical protein EVAR_18006_1 [Eumeta japonica]|uniref:Uncharacterized protein n=1 Tax=Eumeta variegata TaxID=151549 RepID=A0A4C1Y786_EUMVA|nr:hypothetical protein EVAR_18006_1 [Eumeta japonica]